MSKEIIFTKMHDVSDMYFPQPSSSFLPEWYKKTESYHGAQVKNLGFDLNTNATVKKCIPVFDALTSGYIIPTYADLWIKRNNDGHPVYLISDGPRIEYHPIIQAPYHPNMNQFPYPKWINPWGIKTPPGYSVLFVQPFHRESVFTILPGIVDTDQYASPVNFPFVLNDINFEGLIPAGTPVAQVIPFQREEWQMEIGKQESLEEISKVTTKLRTRFFDSYKAQYRQEKIYR